MAQRKIRLVKGEVYHVCARSIQEYKIFNNESEYKRMLDVIRYYLMTSPPCPFSLFLRAGSTVDCLPGAAGETTKLTNILAYCIMPTHIHLILEELTDNGISNFMGKILNSYAKYFNQKHKRTGPLWSGRFRNVHIEDDSQLMHTTRYLHLNPVTSYLTEHPEEWPYSSYPEYIEKIPSSNRICNHSKFLDITPKRYSDFVISRKEVQRKLAESKTNPGG